MNRQESLKKLMLTVAVLALAGSPAFAQATRSVQLKPQELGDRAKELKLKPTELKGIRAAAAKLVAFNDLAVIQEFTGNFESVAKSYDEFSKEFRVQKIQAAPRHPAILILLEDPTGKGEFRYAVGYEVQANLEPKAPLKLHHMEHQQAVRYTRVGAYEELENVHHGVKASVKEIEGKETKFPMELRLLSDPRKVGPAQRRTEIIVPVS